MGDKEILCPKCDAPLRVRTYEEIIEEMIETTGVSRQMAVFLFIPRTGGMPRWWCEGCEIEYSPYTLMERSLLKVEEIDG